MLRGIRALAVSDHKKGQKHKKNMEQQCWKTFAASAKIGMENQKGLLSPESGSE